jgi:hypothetical protein
MRRLAGRRWTGPVGISVIALLLFSLASAAGAHSTDQPYLYVFVTESGIDGRAELAIGDVEEVLGLDLSGDDATIEAALRDNADTLYRYLTDHLAISTVDQDRAIEFGAVDLFREGSTELAFAVIQFTAGNHTTIPKMLDIRFDPFFDEIEGKDGLLLISGGFELGEFTTAKETLVNVNAGERQPRVDLGADGRWGNFRSSISLGVNHIETGPDHILFILALLIPSVLVFTDRWEPLAGFGAGLWRVLKIATFFTLAHSITFTLAGMGWLPTPPAKIVEATIAISIAAAALHTLRPVMPNREWILSFVFGLFHGMGFASLVSDLGVSRSSQLISLLGRNVGIEIGQVVVILLLFPGLYLLRRTPFYQPFVIVASMALAAVASLWTVERLAEVDLGTDGLVDSFASVPRGYWLSLAFAALGAMAFVWSRRNDRLIDPVS